MKRLVICCDGTWNKPENENITNVEKIARTVQTDVTQTAGVQQLVQYIGGVGANWYWLDRIVGGAFGFGLFGHITTAYRFLALNYEPGDQIFIFGFSRGAYTARSLAGMMLKVGLITRDAVIANKLPEAVNRYRRTFPRGRAPGSSDAEFRRDHCHPDLKVDFLGVFDTVGALGIPGALGKGHTFHNVKLSPQVVCARQALAIDERRIKFEPCLWEVEPVTDTPGRVKQVWFEGVHSDVGGGYETTGLSDTALLWMLQEANMQSLVFDVGRLNNYIASNSAAERHESLTLPYRVLNVIGRLRNRINGNQSFDKGWRRLEGANARDVRIASSAQAHYDSSAPAGAAVGAAAAAAAAAAAGTAAGVDSAEAYLSRNVKAFLESKGGAWSDATVVPVIALPEAPGALEAALAAEYIDLGAANPPRVPPLTAPPAAP